MWAAAEADFHAQDIGTLNLIIDVLPQCSTTFSRSSICCEAFIRNRIERLFITLSRPLAFFRVLETCSLSGKSSSHLELEQDARAWVDATNRLPTGLPRLRKLLLWFDHTGREYWSVVNERALLSPILSATAAFGSLDVVIVLPKAHPSIASNQKHFLENNLTVEVPRRPSLTVAVHRVLRRRLRAAEGSHAPRGNSRWCDDFPHLLNHPYFRDTMSLAEIEEYETKGWLIGVDINASLRGEDYRVPLPPTS